MAGKQLGSLSMEKRREGEELCEMAAVHLAPNICLSSDGLRFAAAREVGAIFSVGETAAGHEQSCSSRQRWGVDANTVVHLVSLSTSFLRCTL